MFALAVIGFIVLFVGQVMLIALAFREHILWGVAALFVPFASLVFAIMHWDRSRTAVSVYGAGLLLVIIGAMGGGVVPPKKPEVAAKTVEEVKTDSAAALAAMPVVSQAPPPAAPQPRFEPEPAMKKIEQVYADNATHTFYSEKCGKRPPNAYRVAKSIAIRQGFIEASCP